MEQISGCGLSHVSHRTLVNELAINFVNSSMNAKIDVLCIAQAT